MFPARVVSVAFVLTLGAYFDVESSFVRVKASPMTHADAGSPSVKERCETLAKEHARMLRVRAPDGGALRCKLEPIAGADKCLHDTHGA